MGSAFPFQELDVLYITSWQMLLLGVVFAGILPLAFTLKTLLMLLYLAILSALGIVNVNRQKA